MRSILQDLGDNQPGWRTSSINFEKSIARPGDDRVIYRRPTFTSEAKLLFDEKIKTLDDFKELVMGEKKESNRIAITTFNGQFNNANGNAIINAVQNNNSHLQEILKFFDELEKHIPHDISKEVKEQLDESIDTIKAELQSPRPKINVIKTLVIGLKGLVNTAEFAAAAVTILEFIDKLPK
ncbi:MAG: hypothetical protein LBC53_00435 [Spirochaetaceae bacterium]|jgi:hypothetical protein|nr:hypothetical protein [Spirochaetaceae bacterium]